MTDQLATPTTPPIFSVIPGPEDYEHLPTPDAGPYYVIDGRNTYVHRQTKIGRVLAKLKKLPHNIKPWNIEGYFWHAIPDIPVEVMGQVLGFFHFVYDKMKAEAMVILLLDKDNNYSVIVPDQEVTGASIDYKLETANIPDDKMMIGTIHSHCEMSAFHSHTDEGDADKHDGIHITIGRVTSQKPDYAMLISFNEILWRQFKLADHCKIDEIERLDFPGEWLQRVKHAPAVEMKPATSPSNGNWNGYPSWGGGWGDGYDYGQPRKPKGLYQTPKPDNRTDPSWFWPIDSDYSDKQGHAAEQLKYDLEQLQKIAARRGLRLRFKITVRNSNLPVVAASDHDQPHQAS